MYVVAWKVDNEELFVRRAESKEICGFATREEAQSVIEKIEHRIDVVDYFYIIELESVRH
jgi:hypothetical protein